MPTRPKTPERIAGPVPSAHHSAHPAPYCTHAESSPPAPRWEALPGEEAFQGVGGRERGKRRSHPGPLYRCASCRKIVAAAVLVRRAHVAGRLRL